MSFELFVEFDVARLFSGNAFNAVGPKSTVSELGVEVWQCIMGRRYWSKTGAVGWQQQTVRYSSDRQSLSPVSTTRVHGPS